MKVWLISLASAQYTASNVTPEGAKFATSVFNTMMLCNDWTERALSCDKVKVLIAFDD